MGELLPILKQIKFKKGGFIPRLARNQETDINSLLSIKKQEQK